MPTITTFLTYDTQAEEAANFYTSIFDGKILSTVRYPPGGPKPEGTVLTVTFQLLGQTFIALNGGPTFVFSQAFSMLVACDTQAEIDHYWDKLTAGGRETQCGWLVDKFGVSWQVAPKMIGDLIGNKDAVKAGRAMQAMMPMKKLDIATLKRAFDGA